MVLMSPDCGHSSDTFSLCHTVCQQQAPHADHDVDDDEDDDDDEEEEEDGEEGDDDDEEEDDDDHEEDDDEDSRRAMMLFSSHSQCSASHSKFDAEPEIW